MLCDTSKYIEIQHFCLYIVMTKRKKQVRFLVASLTPGRPLNTERTLNHLKLSVSKA